MTRILQDTGVDRIRKIPQDRKLMRVKDIFFRRKEVNTEDDPVVLSLARAGVKVRDISTNEGQLAESYDNYHRVYKKDLMINPMDLYSGANCSVSNVEGVISPAYINLASNKKIDSRYFDYYFKNQYRVNAMFVHGKGVSFDNRWTINNDTMMNYYIPVPSYEEQKAIADYLDEKCNIINVQKKNYEELIELLKKYKQSFILKTISQYKRIKLKFLLKDNNAMRVGPFGSQLSGDDFKDSGYRVYTQRTVIDNNFETNDTFINEEKYKAMQSFKVNAGDILLTTRGSIGKICIVPKTFFEGILHPCLIKFNLDNYNYKLLSYIFNETNFVKEQLSYLSNSTTIEVVYSNTLKNIEIPYPNKEEQEKIVNYLDKKCSQLDKLINYREKMIDKLEEYRRSLIYEYVTGKKEIK